MFEASSSLFHSQMPKGALLHAHLGATINARVLLQLALKQPAMHVRVTEAISSSTIATALPEFKALPKEQFSDSAGLTDPSYIADEWTSIQKARETFDPQLGGPQGFDDWVFGALTINPKEAYDTHNTVAEVS